jgi:AcrR family transcriptional regulator
MRYLTPCQVLREDLWKAMKKAVDARAKTPDVAAMSTRERILHETWHMLEQRRGQSVRLEDIAKAAGVSRQAIYLHFGSRAELFIQTARYADERLNAVERFQAVCAEKGDRALDAFIAWWASYIPDIYGLAKAFLTLQATDEAAAAAWADRKRAMYQGSLIALQAVRHEGLLASQWTVRLAADFLWAILSIETWEYLTIDRGWSNEQYVERMQMAAQSALTRER